MFQQFNKQTGFTLVELLIVMAIVGVTAAFALATMGSKPMRTYVNTPAREITSILQAARQQAIEGGRVIFVRTTDGTVIQTFLDSNNSGTYDDGQDALIEEVAVNRNKVVLLPTNYQGGMFDYKGNFVQTDGTPTAVSVTVCQSEDGAESCKDGGPKAIVSLRFIGLPELLMGAEVSN